MGFIIIQKISFEPMFDAMPVDFIHCITTRINLVNRVILTVILGPLILFDMQHYMSADM